MTNWKRTSPLLALTVVGVLGCSGPETSQGEESAELPRLEALLEGAGDPRQGAVEPADSRVVAEMMGTTGESVGTVVFSTDPSGSAAVRVQVSVHLPDLLRGPKGFHVHEGTDCTPPDFETAGEHFDPLGSPHGEPSSPPSSRHVGDLGNVPLDESGHIRYSLEDPLITLDRGPTGILGRAVILHEGEDDQTTQPSGDAGDPVACGIVESNR